MESKGRRTPRAVGPTEMWQNQSIQYKHPLRKSKQRAQQQKPLRPAEILAEAAKP